MRAKPNMEPWVHTLKGNAFRLHLGVMRAKPDMEPWVHTDKSRMSSYGAQEMCGNN